MTTTNELPVIKVWFNESDGRYAVEINGAIVETKTSERDAVRCAHDYAGYRSYASWVLENQGYETVIG